MNFRYCEHAPITDGDMMIMQRYFNIFNSNFISWVVEKKSFYWVEGENQENQL